MIPLSHIPLLVLVSGPEPHVASGKDTDYLERNASGYAGDVLGAVFRRVNDCRDDPAELSAADCEGCEGPSLDGADNLIGAS